MEAKPLDSRSRSLRRLALRGLLKGGRGHPGSALSIIEILRVLYDDILRVRPDQPAWPNRDRFILSKGHGCLALYAILADKGFFDPEELDRFCRFDSPLGGHPEYGKVPGVETSTGALGHGLNVGIGMALGVRLSERPSRVFVLMGDGELDEGSVWEGALCAAKHKLDHLTALVDYNKLQSYGPVAEVLALEPLADKWRAFGFAVREVDGHDPLALKALLKSLPFEPGKPSCLICHTVKGRGIALAENNPDWHHKSKLKPAEAEAVAALLEEP
ncbi:MAG: transketolase [Magnetococcales bacterium]|nr:transketolase [Magnetococcales bacterium]